MFGMFKKAKVGLDPLVAIANFDLSQRLFTKVLLIKTAQVRKAMEEELTNTGMKIGGPPVREATKLDDMIAQGAKILALHIMRGALECEGRTIDLMPMSPQASLPKDAPAFLAFGLIVVRCMQVPLNKEGCSIKFQDLTLDLGPMIYYGWPKNQVAPVVQQAYEVFDFFLNSRTPEVDEWLEDASKLLSTYLEQAITEDQALKSKDVLPAFGVLLRQLARTIRQ